MAELINTNVFTVGENGSKKFVDFAGLDYFWTKAKTYIDGVDATMSAKVLTIEGDVTNLKTTVGDKNNGLVKDVKAIQDELNSLSGGAGSIGTQIANAIATLDVDDTAVEGQYVSAVSEVDGKVVVTRAALPDYTEVYDAKGAAATAEENAKNYADGLAGNYDAKGAAATAEQNAKNYADDEIAEAVGTWTVDETAGTGLRKEIEDKVATVAADAKSYSIAPVTGDELAGLGANVKEAYKLVDEDSIKSGEYIKIYKDSALQNVELVNQELQFTYLLADGTTSMVPVSVATFLAESEFGNGLQVNSESGVVSVKVDAASEGFLTVGADGVKLSGVQTAIDTAAGQALTDANAYTDTVVGVYTSEGVEASGLRKEIEDNERVTAESLTDLDTRVKALEGADDYVEATVNAAIADAKKAGTDAAAALDTYKGEMTTALAGKADKSVVDGLVTTVGNAESGLVKDVADLKAQDVYVKANVDNQISNAETAAIAQAKLDAAAALADYYKKSETYSKTEVDNLLSTNSTGDRLYAKQYTDELFNSFTFASNSDIDALFNKQ